MPRTVSQDLAVAGWLTATIRLKFTRSYDAC
jgi:hypothetical protein